MNRVRGRTYIYNYQSVNDGEGPKECGILKKINTFSRK
jgi:hypothetical protein